MSTNPFQIERKIRDSFILNLRRIFSSINNPVGWKYPYIENAQGVWDFDASKIFIGDAIPQDYAALPMLVVDTYSGNETRYLGPEDLGYTKNSFGVVTEDKRFASIVSTVTINIYTIDDTVARDEIIDTIYDHFKDITTDLATKGIEIIRSTMPTEARVYQDNRWYITNRIVTDVYSEWVDTPTPITNVSAINVTVPLTGPVPVITSALFYEWSGLPFSVTNVTDSTHLEVNSTSGMTNGDTIIQDVHTTTITTVTDGTHLVVGSTIGWVIGVAVDNNSIVPFNYQITAVNNPTSYSSSALPTGLTLNGTNGLISGVPLVTGTFYVSVGATNNNGTGNLSLTINIP